LCLFVFVVFCLLVTFRLRFDIDMTQLSAIEKVTISANDFYWQSGFTMCRHYDVTGGVAEMGQSSPIGFSIVKEKFPQLISRKRCVLEQN
jgi:hypothetical protein